MKKKAQGYEQRKRAKQKKWAFGLARDVGASWRYLKRRIFDSFQLPSDRSSVSSLHITAPSNRPKLQRKQVVAERARTVDNTYPLPKS